MSLEVLATFLKEKSPAFFGFIAISSGFFIFATPEILQKLRVQKVPDEHNLIIGFVFVFSTVGFLVYGLPTVVKTISGKIVRRQFIKAQLAERKEYMDRLTEQEVLYLLPFWGGETTLKFRMDDGVRGGLEGKGIIFRSSNRGSILDGFSYNIQPWALTHLKENPEVFEKFVGKINSEDDFKKIYQNGLPWQRPRW